MNQNILNSLLVAILSVITFSGCHYSDTEGQKTTIVAAQPSDAAKAPKDAKEMFISARFIAANISYLPLEGDLAKFKGTLLDSQTKKNLEEGSDIKTNRLWSAISNLNGYNAQPAVVLSTPVGRFVFFEAIHQETAQVYIVGVNLETKKASILESLYGTYDWSSPDGFLNAAALWAYRAISVIANFEPQNNKVPLQGKVTNDYLALAVGYLYAIESIGAESERRKVAQQQPVSGERTTLPELQGSGFSGEISRDPNDAHSADIFPNNVEKTWRYKPFSITSTQHHKQMSDAYIANTFMCKSPMATLQETRDLIENYDLVDTSKTDNTLTVTSFRGDQEGKMVTVSLAVDEQSAPRLVRYILVDGLPVLSCR